MQETFFMTLRVNDDAVVSTIYVALCCANSKQHSERANAMNQRQMLHIKSDLDCCNYNGFITHEISLQKQHWNEIGMWLSIIFKTFDFSACTDVHIVCVHCTLHRSTGRWLNFHSKLEFGILTRCIIKTATCINPRTVHFSGIFCRRLLHWFINGPFWFSSCAWDFTKIEMNIFFHRRYATKTATSKSVNWTILKPTNRKFNFYYLLLINNSIYCGLYKNLIYFKLIHAIIIHIWNANANNSQWEPTYAATISKNCQKYNWNEFRFILNKWTTIVGSWAWFTVWHALQVSNFSTGSVLLSIEFSDK